jgi:hypothetical protein
MRHLWTAVAAASVAACTCSAYGAKNVLTVGDPILAIDRDVVNLTSIYPANESPLKAIDNLYLPTTPQTSTKYLNFGRFNTGFIVQPSFGTSTIQSFRINTANDQEPRDPGSYQLWGSNDDLMSPDNSDGSLENWTIISSGALSLPSARRSIGPVVSIANGTAYKSYRMVFPTLKIPNAATAMQIGDVEFFQSSDGTGTNILYSPDGLEDIRAIKLSTAPMSESISPVAQESFAVIDGNVNSKYLNFGINNTGFIVTPSRGPEAVNAFQITTANDAEGRDPAKYEIYGTNDAIASAVHSDGAGETWTLISSGDLTLPSTRLTADEVVSFANDTAYASYKVIFPEIKGPAATTVPPAGGTITSMQIANIQFYADGSDLAGDFNGDGSVDNDDLGIWKTQLSYAGVGINADGDNSGLVDGNDFLIWQRGFTGAPAPIAGVPEPAGFALAAIGLAGVAIRRRRGAA